MTWLWQATAAETIDAACRLPGVGRFARAYVEAREAYELALTDRAVPCRVRDTSELCRRASRFGQLLRDYIAAEPSCREHDCLRSDIGRAIARAATDDVDLYRFLGKRVVVAPLGGAS